MTTPIERLLERTAAFETAAHEVLATFDSSPSRVIELIDARKQLAILNLRQDELMREALRAIEHDLLRPAIVVAWAAFMDFLEERLASDGLVAVHAKAPEVAKFTTLDELKENVTEYKLLEIAKATKVTTKSETKALHGLLSKRNECAHPTGYRPTLNEAIGYVAELLNRIPTISQRSPQS